MSTSCFGCAGEGELPDSAVFSRVSGPVSFLHFRFSYVSQHFRVPGPKWCPKRPGLWGLRA